MPVWARSIAIGVLDLLFPPVCGYCGNEADPEQPPPIYGQLCRSCAWSLKTDAERSTCRSCGNPWVRSATPKCPECRRRQFVFHQVISLGFYRGALRTATIRMKQFHEYPLTAAVGRLLAAQLMRGDGLTSSANPQVIVPIPKFWVKRIVRGSSTSELLARTIGRQVRLPVVAAALRCRRNTRKQSLLGIQDRRRNVRGAFLLARGYDFHGVDILLIDDIMTTGATANEAARALRQGGARRVIVAVAARTVVGGVELPDWQQ